MLRFIMTCLKDRKFQVRINNTSSETACLDNGIPQGSVLSPTLFTIFANKLNKYVKSVSTQKSKTKLAQFADDSYIWKSDRT